MTSFATSSADTPDDLSVGAPSVAVENASNSQENDLDLGSAAAVSSKASPPPPPSPAWSKNGPTFAELLKQNIDVAPVAKIRTGVPIMSIPASDSTPATTTNSHKKKARSFGSAVATSSSSATSKKDGNTRSSASDVVADSNKTPSMKSRAAPESPVGSNAADNSPSVLPYNSSSSSSNEHMPSPPMSEIAADENQGQSSPPTVNVWQVRMAQSNGNRSVGSSDGGQVDVGDNNVEGLLDAVEKKLSMADNADNDQTTSDLMPVVVDQDKEDAYINRRKYPYQQQQPFQRNPSRGGGYMLNGGGYPRTNRPRGAYNGVATGGSPRYYGVRSNQQAYVYPVVDVDTLKFYLLGQIEYYFSVENLCRDLFFRSQMDANGWVPISLIAGFNRVRAFTTELALIKEAISQSVILEMNEESIRKKEEWHLWVLPNVIESQTQAEAATIEP